MESLPKRPTPGEIAWERAENQLRDTHGENFFIQRSEEYTGSGSVYRVDNSLEFGYVFEGSGCVLFKLSEN